TLLEILAAEGETVAVGGVLARIGQAGSGTVDSGTVVSGTVVSGTVDGEASDSGAGDSGADGAGEREKPSGRAFISPVVARIAQEHTVDLAAVSGTGLGGRITKKDILAFVASTSSASTSSASTSSATDPLPTVSLSTDPLPTVSLSTDPLPDETLHPLSTMRRAIAQHMVLSKETSPHVTTVYEVDMTAVVRHREANKQPFAEKGLTLTYTPYFVAATAAALQQVPEANSRFTAEGIVLHRRIHIGVAVSLPDGLLVPVVRDADEKNLQGLARAVNELAAQARNGRLAPDATRGGTFTITNHGVTGSLLGTPIINQPQSGILGIGTIAKRAVVHSAGSSLLPSADDAIVIRPICYLSFSFDHRVLDGAKADAFLTVVKRHLENWQ
ncbi:MAG: 2-oxo acid dehydrogenase subunit E2, partial [Caldilineaceae bacterium]|nr:2-oxo acid dehydrogenase subunit E2 [Caldilineaceae bacterium]